jgi:hypothetical protein
MKRRRRGLGSSAQVHAKRGHAAVAASNEAARKVIVFAEDGACDMALSNLTAMDFHHGQALANGKLPNGGLLIQARHRFRRGCMR